MFRPLTDADFDAKHKFSFDMSVVIVFPFVHIRNADYQLELATNLHHQQSMTSSSKITHHGFSGT